MTQTQTSTTIQASANVGANSGNNIFKKALRWFRKEPYYSGKEIKRVRDIPSDKERDELSRTNQAEFDRVYRESMKVLNRATARVSTTAIIIGGISIFLSLLL